MKKYKAFCALIACSIIVYTSKAQGWVANTPTSVVLVGPTGATQPLSVGINLPGGISGVVGPSANLHNNGTVRFENLPANTTSNVLYWDATNGDVTQGPAGAAGITGVDFDCGIGTVTISTVGGAFTSTNGAWLTGGNTPTANDYFGTFSNDDVRINTNNQNCVYDPLAQKMIVTTGGFVGIAHDGTNSPAAFPPRNKLLVQNGDISNDPYQFSYIGPTPTSALGIYSLSIDEPNGVNIPYFAAAINDQVFNFGYAANVQGDDGASLKGFYANLTGDNNSELINPGSGGNRGTAIEVNGDNSNNVGHISDVVGDDNNVFIYNNAYNQNECNMGFFGRARGINSVNIGVMGDVPSTTGNPTLTNSICYGMYGTVNANGGDEHYGVYANLTNNANLATNINYAVVGIQPAGTAGIVTTPTGPVAAGTNYAGYFSGDVFCTNTYYYSDPKLKENIRNYQGALSKLNQLNIKEYTFKTEQYPEMNMPNGNQVGVLSNELKDVFPELVKQSIYPGKSLGKENITYEAVNYNALIPVMVQAVKELDAKAAINEKINEEVAALKTDNESLKKDIADVKEMLDKICSNGCGDFKPASTLGGTTGSESNLFQNVPNPFSNTTVIPYTIGQGVKQAVLTITDLNGTELKRFSTSQAGSGTFEVNMGDLGIGTYIYSLFTDGKLIDTKKMVLAGK